MPDTLTTIAQLEALYGQPLEAATVKEIDRITPHYFDLVLDRMSKLVIDRALNGRVQQSWPRWAQMTGLSDGTASPV